MLDLLHELLRRADAGEAVAACVVARTRGSTPQKAGALMLVLADGRTLGTLGGGCVEAEVRVRAMRLLLAGESRLMTFKLDDDYGWDDGLVCGGTMDVAVQTVASAESAAMWRRAADALANRRTATIELSVADDAGGVFTLSHAVGPPPRLVVAGAGHVGGALATVAAGLGFERTVVDDRPDLTTAARFPGATLVVGEIERELAKLPLGPGDYVVIVTRGHRHDARALAAVVSSKAGYVGLIGSKRKTLTILERLRDEGVPREDLARVRSPIGLDIGAVTPEEIAVSIAAELVAVRRGAGASVGEPMRLDVERFARAIPDIAHDGDDRFCNR